MNHITNCKIWIFENLEKFKEKIYHSHQIQLLSPDGYFQRKSNPFALEFPTKSRSSTKLNYYIFVFFFQRMSSVQETKIKPHFTAEMNVWKCRNGRLPDRGAQKGESRAAQSGDHSSLPLTPPFVEIRARHSLLSCFITIYYYKHYHYCYYLLMSNNIMTYLVS